MINTNDILARLQKGESVEAIAAEFTKTLNEAEKQYNQKSQKAAGAALMGTIQAIGEKNDDIDSVLRAWANKL